jgi:hypothetical protein
MCAAINNSTSCEVRTVIWFLHAKQMSAADIHRKLCVVYGPNIMSEGPVRQWCRMFRNGRTNVHDDERSGQPSVVNDDLVQTVNKKIIENWHFTISELSFEFPHISRTILCKIVTHKLGYHKFCARWVPKMLTDAHKMQRMASALTFLERYCKDGNEFLNHIVTEDETWVSCVNVETKEQFKQWMHTHSPNKPRKFKQTLSARKLMATVFWDRKGVLLVDFMLQGTTTVSEVYCETLEKL